MENYFSFFDLEPAFNIDAAKLKKAYLIKSREFHPDYFSQASEEEKNRALDMTTRNNAAFKTLSDPVKRLEHILRLNNILGESKDEKMDPEFLMEMMDINEQIMEHKMEEGSTKADAIKADIDELSKGMDLEANGLKDAYDQSNETEHLQKLKAYFFKKKYIARILQQLEGEEPGM